MVTLWGKVKKVRKGVTQDLGHLATKGHAALKDYAAKAPERRQARLDKINQQAEIAEAQARLARAQKAKNTARAAARLDMGFGGGGMGLGSPSMGLGAPVFGGGSSKPAKKKKSTKRQPKVVIY